MADANTTQSTGKTEAETLAAKALEDAQRAVDELAAEPTQGASNLHLPNFQKILADVEAAGLGLIGDVQLDVTIELGRTNMLVEDVLRLAEGSVVELDKLAGDPVDIFVNKRLVARGEVLVVNDNFCVRVSEIVGDIGDVVGQEAANQAQSGN